MRSRSIGIGTHVSASADFVKSYASSVCPINAIVIAYIENES